MKNFISLIVLLASISLCVFSCFLIYKEQLIGLLVLFLGTSLTGSVYSRMCIKGQ